MSEHEGTPVWGDEVLRNLREATETLKAFNDDPVPELRPISTHRRCIDCGSIDVMYFRCAPCEAHIQEAGK